MTSQVKPTEISLEEWEAGVIERYSILRQVVSEKIPDAWEPLEFTLCVAMILNIKGNTLPFAGIILANASSFKTVGIEMLRTCPNTFYTNNFTPKSFVSHNTGVSKKELEKIDMLPRIQDKVFLAPELSPTFTKKDEDLIELIGILTSVLDGHGFESDSGAHGHRGYTGEYMFTMVGAAVDIPHRVHRILGTLGPKLYFLRLHERKKSDETYLNEIKNDSFNEDLLSIQKQVGDYLSWFEQCPIAEVIEKKSSTPDKPPEFIIKIEWNKDKDEEEALNVIVRLGKLLSYLRGVIPTWETRDSQGIDYAYTIASKENPDRAMIQLRNLARGHALLEGRNYITVKDIPILIQVTLSTASRERVKVFELLTRFLGEITTSQIEKELNTSANTAKRTMAEFVALGIVNKQTYERREGNLLVKEYKFTLNPELDWFLDSDFKKLRDSQL